MNCPRCGAPGAIWIGAEPLAAGGYEKRYRCSKVRAHEFLESEAASAPATVIDPKKSEEARDEALRQVTRKPFTDEVEPVVFGLSGQELTGEDIRVVCEERGVVPHHSNAWGGVIGALQKRGLLVRTGEYRRMGDVRSHARETPVYLVVANGAGP